MAQGYVLGGGGAKITLTDQNVTVKTEAGTKKLNNLFVKMPDGSSKDILYHVPAIPPAGKVMNGTVDGLSVPFYGNGRGGYAQPGGLITASGYNLAATIASGGKCRLRFYRDGGNDSYWFSVRLFAWGNYAGDAPIVPVYTWFSYTIDRSLLGSQFSLAWTDAPSGAGQTGRYVQIGQVYTLEMI